MLCHRNENINSQIKRVGAMYEFCLYVFFLHKYIYIIMYIGNSKYRSLRNLIINFITFIVVTVNSSVNKALGVCRAYVRGHNLLLLYNTELRNYS